MQNFKNLLALQIAFFWAFAISACSLAPTPTQNPTTFILQSDDKIVLKNAKKSAKSIQIAPTQSPLYLRSNEIIYLQNNELNSYAKHLWKSPPTSALQSILASKFEKNKLFAVVLNSNSQVKADLLLETRFDRFEQVFSNENDSEIVLNLSVNLIDNNAKKVLGSENFSYKIKVDSISVNDSTNAFNKTINTACDDVILWISKIL